MPDRAESRRSRGLRPLVLLAAGVTTAALAAPAAASSAADGFAPDVERAAVGALATAGLSPSRAEHRLHTQRSSAALADRLTHQLGSRAAGAFLDPAADAPVVNVLDPAAARDVTAAGATAHLVRHDTAALTAAADRLAALPAVPSTAYGVDPVTDQLVVTVGRGAGGPGLARLLGAAGALGDLARVRYTPGPLREHLADGDEISTGEIVCSAGFNVHRGGQDYLVDAGHCTAGLPFWQGVGPSVDSRFPGTDYGLIRNDSGDAPGVVDTYNGGAQPITRAGNAQVGENVCKSGRTTGLTCGTVTALNQTVNYDDGHGGVQSVHGLIQTNVVCDHGDSGGPLFDGSTGLGTVSGGDGTTDYFQPLPPALAAYGVALN